MRTLSMGHLVAIELSPSSSPAVVTAKLACAAYRLDGLVTVERKAVFVEALEAMAVEN